MGKLRLVNEKTAVWKCCPAVSVKVYHLKLRVIYPETLIEYYSCTEHCSDMAEQIAGDIRVNDKMMRRRYSPKVEQQTLLQGA